MNFLSLTAPFPAPGGSRKRWRICFAVALFVTLFLLVFQPFGLSSVPKYKTLVIIGYGLITLLGMWVMYIALPFLFPKFFREENWVVWKSLAELVGSMLLIATGNLLYSAWLGFFPLTGATFLHFIGITLAVGVFPGAASFLIAHYLLLKKYLSEAKQLTQNLPQQTNQIIQNPEQPAEPGNLPATDQKPALAALHDEEGRLVLQISATNLLCLAAADNYTEVFYLQKGELKKELIRNSLKNLEKQISHSPRFYRCHRSYVINLGKVTEVTGNAQGYKVKLPVMKELVPVSRSRSAEFGELLGRLPTPKKLPLAPKS